MKKKIFIIIICFAICLSACANVDKQPTTQFHLTEDNEHLETNQTAIEETEPIVPMSISQFESVNEIVYALADVHIRIDWNENSQRIGTLSAGNSITRVGIGINGWSMVTYNDGTAFIASEYLSTQRPPESPVKNTGPTNQTEFEKESSELSDTVTQLEYLSVNETVYALTTVNVRTEPNTDSNIVGVLKLGEEVIRIGVGDDGWSLIKYDNKTAYVVSRYLSLTNPNKQSEETIQKADEIVYATVGVNIRSGPSTEHSKIGSLNMGDSIKRIGICDNGWSQVEYNGESAYILSKYLTTEKPDNNSYSETENGSSVDETNPEFTFTVVNEIVYATTGVYIRSGPSTSNAKIGSLIKGNSIKRIGISNNGWSQVEYDGKIAYISSEYLTTEKPTV